MGLRHAKVSAFEGFSRSTPNALLCYLLEKYDKPSGILSPSGDYHLFPSQEPCRAILLINFCV